MKKNKGFTLIELLTVIAILAIILLIAAPTILGILDKARKNTFKNQVLLYVESLKQQVVLKALNQADMSITLPDVGSFTLVNISDIPMDTSTNLSGSIRIENENGNYKYILVEVQNADYKVTREVEARSLGLSDIEKNDGTGTLPSTPTYAAYAIGQEVTLKDNTTWYVIEYSDSSSDTVTLFASQNIKKDASGWTAIQDEYKIAFDETNARTTENNSYCTTPEHACNIYAAQEETVTNGDISGTVTQDSTIKKFIDSKVLTYINNSLTGNGGTAIDSIGLITTDEICNIIDAANSSNNCTLSTLAWSSNGNKKITEVFSNVPSWLYSNWYWTMTPHVSEPSIVYGSNTSGYIGNIYANNDSLDGIRPVIVTNKSNIK